MDLATIGFRSDTRELERGARGLNSLADTGERTERRLASSTASSSNNFARLAGAIGTAAAALTAFRVGAASLEAFKIFETGLVGVAKTTGLAGAELDKFSNRISDMALKIPVSTTELLELAQAAGQMGVKGSDNLEKFALTVAKLGRASDLSGELAAKSLARILNVTGESIDSIDTLASVIVSLGNNSAATESEIARMTTEVARATSVFGVTSSEAAGLGAAMASIGIQAETGGSSVGRTMQAITSAVKNGGDEIREFTQTLGINGEALTKAFQEDKVKAFEIVLQAVAKQGLNAGSALKEVGLGGQEIAKTIVPLANNIGILSDSLALANKESKNATALNREYAASLKTLQSEQDLAANTAKAYSIAIGGELAPAFSSLLSVFNSFGGTSQEVTANVEATGDALKAMSAVVGLALIPVMGRYIITLAAATTATNVLAVSTRILLGPWGVLIAAVGVAATVFTTSKNESDKLAESLATQKKRTDELTTSLELMNTEQINTKIIAIENEKIRLIEKRLAVQLEAEKQAKMNTTNRFGGETGLLASEAEIAVAAVDKQLKTNAESMKIALGIQDELLGKNAADDAEELEEKLKNISEAYQKWLDKINGFRTPMQQVTAEITKINKALASGDLNMTGGVIAKLTELSAKSAELDETGTGKGYQDWLDGIVGSSTAGQLKSITEEIEKVSEAMAMSDLPKNVGAERLEELRDRYKDLSQEIKDDDMFDSVTGGIADSLNAMKGFAKEGSKEFQALSIAADAFNLVQAIGAVINQASSGEPYSAFPRMAAMIGAMASLGQSIGGFGGGSMQDESAANQAAQGLNQVGEKSNSISEAIELTADATDKLVGINTSMLRALESLQQNISGASSIVARGASDVDINPPSRVDDNPLSFITDNSAANIFGSNIFTEVFDFLGLNWLFEGIGSLLGGSSSTVDTGIRIIGGEIGDLLESVTVQAFEEIKSKKYAWRSSNYDTYFAPLDNASTQFGLVFQSLADSVFEGATSLGISGSNAIDAINRFQVETTKISLKGLSADDQQAEIEAVFSKIFNDLALAVVPFAADFQQAGEEIGATLSRISTQVAVADFAVTNLGIDLGEKLGNSKLYVRIADNLSMMTGGIEDFASKISSFVEDFAPESVKFSLFSNTLKDALSDVGLEVPATTEGFYNLMASLDGTTAAGQQQIAALLNSQDVASGYFDLLEDRNEELDSFSDSLLTLTDNLRGAIVSIYGTSVAASTLSLNSALEAARIGDFSEALGLNLSNLNPNQSNFGSIQSFNIEQAKTANKLAELADLTAGTATVEDMALTAAQEQVALLGSINTNIASASVPQVQQAQNNDNIVIELKSIKADIEKIKQADQAIAKSSAKSANHLETMEYDGVDVRVEA